MKVILASTSPFRRALLERLTTAFEVIKPTVDEEALKSSLSHLSPTDLAMELASAKARSIVETQTNAIVIGSDQLVAFQGEILGKPKTHDQAQRQLMSLQGQTHELITATSIFRGVKEIRNCQTIRMHMRSLSAPRIKRYLDQDQPLQCAGSYMYEKLGISLFEWVEMQDETAIQGLPLIFVTRALNELGIEIP